MHIFCRNRCKDCSEAILDKWVHKMGNISSVEYWQSPRARAVPVCAGTPWAAIPFAAALEERDFIFPGEPHSCSPRAPRHLLKLP